MKRFQQYLIGISGKWNWVDGIVITLLLGISLVLWLPTRYYPYHWDAAGYVINEAVSIQERGFWPLDTRFSDFSHPPLLPVILAYAWQVFGHSKLVSHLVIFPFLPILVISVYLIGKHIASRHVGVIGAFLTLSTPVVIAEYGNIYPDLPMAALIMLSLVFWLSKRHALSMIVFTLAVLLKESALFYLPTFILSLPVSVISKKPRYLLWLALPVGVILAWFILHGSVAGWYLVKPDRPTVVVNNAEQLLQSALFVANELLVKQNRLLLIALTIVASIIVYLKSKTVVAASRHIRWLLLSAMIVYLVYVILGEFALRYGIAMLSMVYLASMALLSKVLKKNTTSTAWSLSLVGAASVLANLMIWHPTLPETKAYSFRPSDDLGYIDMIHIFRQLGAFASMQGDVVKWYGSFPENIYLTQPYLMYVQEPLDFSLCSTFTLKPEYRQLLVLHAYSPEQIICRDLLNQVTVNPVRKLQSKDKWLDIYEVVATPSATKK